MDTLISSVASAPEVLLLCAGSGFGGMERVVLNLSGELLRRQFPVRVILPDSDNALQTQEWFAASGVAAEITPALKHSFGKRRISSIPALSALLAASPAPVVNLHYGMNFPSLNDVLAVRLAGKRCVASVHAGGGSDPPAPFLRQWKNQVAARLCDSIVAVSVFQAEELIKRGIPRRKVRVVPIGIPEPTNAPTRAEARAILGIPDTAFVMLAASRLTTRKGIHDLIPALARLQETVPKMRGEVFLLVAGEGPERLALEAQAEAALPRQYRFLGFVPNMTTVYQAADIFALPSYEESFGLAYAEAAIHSLPVVGTTVGGVPETVLQGKTGLLVPPGDISRLEEALYTLWQSPTKRTAMGQLAKRRADRDFTLNRMADRYLQVLLPAHFGTMQPAPAAYSSQGPNLPPFLEEATFSTE